ncbi:MAG: hypothetical protein ABFC88_12465 [Thermoguttaceae bacterium]
MRTVYYEINVHQSEHLFIGGMTENPSPLVQRDRTYYLYTNAGVVLKIAYRGETWRIKQVAGPAGRREKAAEGGWSDCFYHPGEVTSFVFGMGHGFEKTDVAEHTIPGYLIPE